MRYGQTTPMTHPSIPFHPRCASRRFKGHKVAHKRCAWHTAARKLSRHGAPPQPHASRTVHGKQATPASESCSNAKHDIHEHEQGRPPRTAASSDANPFGGRRGARSLPRGMQAGLAPAHMAVRPKARRHPAEKGRRCASRATLVPRLRAATTHTPSLDEREGRAHFLAKL